MKPVKLDLGFDPANLRVSTVNPDKKKFRIQVLSPLNAQGKRKIYYDRISNDEIVNIPLPKHSNTVFIRTTGIPINNILTGPLKPPKIPYLDKPTRKAPYSADQIRIEKNPNLKSPALIFRNKPVIQYNPLILEKLPTPVQTFILFHEMGHIFFGPELSIEDREIKTDRWAVVTFLNEGYPLSSALYALTKVLNRSPLNVKRIIEQSNLLKQLSMQYYG